MSAVGAASSDGDQYILLHDKYKSYCKIRKEPML